MSAQQDFLYAYDAVTDKHGIGQRGMLVLLKAYAQYKADEGLEKPLNERGWMNAVYDVLPCFNRFGDGPVYIPDSFSGAEDFWETDANKAYWRLSETGLTFVGNNPDLLDAAMPMLKAVINV